MTNINTRKTILAFMLGFMIFLSYVPGIIEIGQTPTITEYKLPVMCAISTEIVAQENILEVFEETEILMNREEIQEVWDEIERFQKRKKELIVTIN